MRPFTTSSTLGEIQASFVGRLFVKQVKANMAKAMGGEGMAEFTKIIDAMPPAVMDGLVEMMNGHFFCGLKNGDSGSRIPP